MADPDYPRYGRGTISGELSWAFLVRTTDPYHLTPSQFQVANRVFSRWRELVAFEAAAGSHKSTYRLDLSVLLGDDLPPGIPRYLDMRVVAHKLAQRIQALQAGESPEALKLGRTLSAGAAIRLLKDLEHHLHPHHEAGAKEHGEIELVFGGDHAYALLNNKLLNFLETEGTAGRSLGYQKTVQYGFERVSHMPTEVKNKLDIPSERWMMVDGNATHLPVTSQTRLLAPCLVAALIGGKPRLGVMSSLQSDDDGSLSARLTWHADGVEACTLKRMAPRGNRLVRVPAFVRQDGAAYSLIVPADAGARLGVKVELSGDAIESLVPGEVLERGTDFVHYACKLP